MAADPSPSNPIRRVVLLHINDGRENAAIRQECFRRHAQHYRLRELIELDLPHLHSNRYTTRQDPGHAAALRRPQMLITALSQAMELNAAALIWPVQFNGDFGAISRVTEKILLVRHLAQLELAASLPTSGTTTSGPAVPMQELPAIETPLLDLTDRQLIELGAHVDAPWHMAWTCERAASIPCRICGPCRRRRAAFESAGVAEDAPASRTG